MEVLTVQNLLVVLLIMSVISCILTFFALSFHKRSIEAHMKLALASGRIEALNSAINTLRNNLYDDEEQALLRIIDDVNSRRYISKRIFVEMLKDRIEQLG